MNASSWYFVYGTVADNLSLSLTVVEDGRILGLATPGPYSSAPAARFSAHRDPATCARWRAMLDASGYREAPRRTVLRPGEQAVTVGVGAGVGLPEIVAFAFDEVPPSLSPLRAELDALLAELRRGGG